MSLSLVYVIKTARRKWDKIHTTPVLSRNRIFKRREFNFVSRFESGFETKLRKDFRDFERDGGLKRQNGKTEKNLE